MDYNQLLTANAVAGASVMALQYNVDLEASRMRERESSLRADLAGQYTDFVAKQIFQGIPSFRGRAPPLPNKYGYH